MTLKMLIDEDRHFLPWLHQIRASSGRYHRNRVFLFSITQTYTFSFCFMPNDLFSERNKRKNSFKTITRQKRVAAWRTRVSFIYFNKNDMKCKTLCLWVNVNIVLSLSFFSLCMMHVLCLIQMALIYLFLLLFGFSILSTLNLSEQEMEQKVCFFFQKKDESVSRFYLFFYFYFVLVIVKKRRGEMELHHYMWFTCTPFWRLFSSSSPVSFGKCKYGSTLKQCWIAKQHPFPKTLFFSIFHCALFRCVCVCSPIEWKISYSFVFFLMPPMFDTYIYFDECERP